MEYTIHPIQTLSAFTCYAKSRCTYNRKFYPDQGPYFQNTFEIDYYDLFSRNFGISVKEEKHNRLVGFVRITQNLQEEAFWKTPLAAEIHSFISRAIKELDLQVPKYELPSFQEFKNTYPGLHQQLKNKQNIAELGRLIILDSYRHPFLPIKLISYALAASIFQGIKYMLIKTTKKHAQFYHAYFHSFYQAEPSGEGPFFPSVYKLDALSDKSMKTIVQMLDQFQTKGKVVPLSFSQTSLIPTLSNPQSTPSC